MTQLTIRKSGGSTIISLPKAVLKTLHLHEGSVMTLTLEGNKIVLVPAAKEEMTLAAVLAGSPKERLTLTAEDEAWLNEKPVGKEDV